MRGGAVDRRRSTSSGVRPYALLTRSESRRSRLAALDRSQRGQVGIAAVVRILRRMTDPRPRDDRDAAQDTARDLAEIAGRIGQFKGDANAYLTDPNYETLKLRLENAHASVEAAAVEARRRVRLNEGR
jgi:hypothetical protein